MYPTLLTLPAGTELANCTETAMFYDRVLAGVYFFFFGLNASILKFNSKNIKWQYEPVTFKLSTCSYTPDFYLPATDEWIEVKGLWRDGALQKCNLFKEELKCKLTILTQKEIDIIEPNYKKLFKETIHREYEEDDNGIILFIN